MTTLAPAVFIAGVDLGGTWIRVGLAARDGKVRQRGRARTQAARGPAGVLGQIEALVRALVEAEPGARLADLILAIGVPGPLDRNRGLVMGAPNLPGWSRVPVRDRLSELLGCQCLIEHDASLAALAEHRRGTGRGTEDFAYVTVSTGIGAGLILGGQLYSGHQGSAGEFGHMVIEPDGPLCNCGNRGCLEAVASGTAIAKAAGASSASEVGRLAAQGDPEARRVLERAGRYVGLALGGLINLLNPEAIAVGGGVVASSPELFDAILASIGDASFPSARGGCRVERAALGEDQGLLGAVELGLDFAREQALLASVALP